MMSECSYKQDTRISSPLLYQLSYMAILHTPGLARRLRCRLLQLLLDRAEPA